LFFNNNIYKNLVYCTSLCFYQPLIQDQNSTRQKKGKEKEVITNSSLNYYVQILKNKQTKEEVVQHAAWL
jgi:hypothetical protein